MCLSVSSVNSLSCFAKAGHCLAASLINISSYSICKEALHLLRLLLSEAFKILTVLVQMYWIGFLKFSYMSS